MDADDMQIDPAVAEAMGFSGFGMQTTKKRKHDSEDAFVGTTTMAPGPVSEEHSQRSEKEPAASARGPETVAKNTSETTLGVDGKPTLDALRHGVRNAQGDMVYFLPSFVEDPWKGLRQR